MASQSVYVMAKLGLADLIASGVTEAKHLASATDCDPDAMVRLLRVLSDLGLVAGDTAGGYRLTPTGESLRDDSPTSVRNMVLHLGGEHYRAWSELLYSIQTGKPAMERALGGAMFAYLDSHPEAAAVFDRAMADLVRTLVIPALSRIDLSRSATVVDVGGGNGSALCHLLQTNPGLRGVLFERPDAIAHAVPALRTGDLADRCELVAGDFFDQVVGGGDTYLVSRVVHDFDDRRATQLLSNVRAAMPADGQLVVLERILPDDNRPHAGKLMDLSMLVANGGRERSAREFGQLLAAASFRLDRIDPSTGPLEVITARPA
jgi:hypothetical protein